MNTPHKHLDNSENRIPAITRVSGCWNGADSGLCCARRRSTPRACARRGPRRGCLAISFLKGGSCSRCEPPEMVRPSVWRATPRCADNLTVFSHCTCRARAPRSRCLSRRRGGRNTPGLAEVHQLALAFPVT